jgi:hypothetical protein
LFIFSPSAKSDGLKLPQLLSQFLYQTKRLDLPGIGSFSLDASTVLPQESDKVSNVPASGIRFLNANISVADDALVTFIKEHTGKMKSLAAADLDFFLTTGRQLLNIGKPFYLEGIGTLLKNKEGRLDFTPGEYLVPKLEDLSHPERRVASERRTGAPATGYDEPPREEAPSGNGRQTLLLIGIIAGIAIIAFGGYYLYKKNNYTESSTENQARAVVPESTATKSADTTALAGAPPSDSTVGGKKDTALANAGAKTANPADASAAKPAAAAPVPPVTATAGATPAATTPTAVQSIPTPAAGQGLYRFVILRTENKNHALRRYNQLLGYQLNIHMETKDSSFFKLYFPIAAAIRDTTHIRDSLADVYASRVTIEQ